MSTLTLLREIDLPEDEILRDLDAIFGPDNDNWLASEPQTFHENGLVTGRVLQVAGDCVRVDVGYKSDGVLELREWYDESAGGVIAARAGDEVELLLLAVEDEEGEIVLSYRKARQKAAWEDFIASHKDGDEISGTVYRRVSGGLLVNVGVSAFLPASQV